MHKFLIATVLLALAVTACSTGPDSGSDKLRVVATTSIVGDVVSNVVGDQAVVEVLIPPGGDPHEFQLSAKQVAQLREADLVVAIGLGLEPSITSSLDEASADGVEVLELAPLLDPRSFPDGTPDPHVWLDPIRMVDAAQLIAGTLTAIDPSVDWVANADAYGEELQDADRQIADLIDSLAADERQMVTNHDAFGYFADRYGLEIVGVIIPGGSTLANPSSAELAELVRVIDQLSVPAIFAESTESDQLANAIAGETKESVVVIELLTESIASDDASGDSLIGMLLTDAERIVAGLGGEAEMAP